MAAPRQVAPTAPRGSGARPAQGILRRPRPGPPRRGCAFPGGRGACGAARGAGGRARGARDGGPFKRLQRLGRPGPARPAPSRLGLPAGAPGRAAPSRLRQPARGAPTPSLPAPRPGPGGCAAPGRPGLGGPPLRLAQAGRGGHGEAAPTAGPRGPGRVPAKTAPSRASPGPRRGPAARSNPGPRRGRAARSSPVQGQPRTPERPGRPLQSRTPERPGRPVQSRTPERPGRPVQSRTPERPGRPVHPRPGPAPDPGEAGPPGPAPSRASPGPRRGRAARSSPGPRRGRAPGFPREPACRRGAPGGRTDTRIALRSGTRAWAPTLEAAGEAAEAVPRRHRPSPITSLSAHLLHNSCLPRTRGCTPPLPVAQERDTHIESSWRGPSADPMPHAQGAPPWGTPAHLLTEDIGKRLKSWRGRLFDRDSRSLNEPGRCRCSHTSILDA
ncbi:uncharacterized protein LOC141496575 [Macrotis lagotis]|uniref:uncharacterized protein LOC141496575 n=1 Tax=Macrotis lagotis TaxID=92651 RepID=UPI003D691AAB